MRRSFLRDEGATAAVEFALTLPLLLLLLFGTLVFAMYCATVNGLEQLAAGAARQSIAGLSGGERALIASQYVQDHAGQYPYLARSSLAAAVADDDSAGTTTVVLTYQTAATPIFSVATRMVPVLPRTLTRTAIVPQGGR